MDSESSQTLEVIKDKINEIKRFSNLDIIPNEKENCLRKLEKYSIYLEKLKKNEESHTKIVEIRRMIFEVEQKLLEPNSNKDSLLDFTHNLFPLRFSSQNKKNNSRLKQIKSELYELLKSLFSRKIENQETVQEILNNYSRELNKFKNKSNQTEIEEIQNIIDLAKGFLFQRREKQQQTKNSDSQLRKLQNIQRASYNRASLDDLAILLQFIKKIDSTEESTEEIRLKKTRISEYIAEIEEIFANCNEKYQKPDVEVDQNVDEIKKNLMKCINLSEIITTDQILNEWMKLTEKLKKCLNKYDSEQKRDIISQLSNMAMEMKNCEKGLNMQLIEKSIKNLEELFENCIHPKNNHKVKNNDAVNFIDDTKNLCCESTTKHQEDFYESFKHLKELISDFTGNRKLYEHISKALNDYHRKTNEILKEIHNSKMVLDKKNVESQQFDADSELNGIKEEESSQELPQDDPKLKKIKDDLSNVRRRLEDPNSNNEELDQLETINKFKEKFEKIKPEIRQFVGLENDEKYLEFDATMIQITLALDNLIFDKNSDLHRRKVHLMREIHEYWDILDERVKQTEEIENMEKQIDGRHIDENRFF